MTHNTHGWSTQDMWKSFRWHWWMANPPAHEIFCSELKLENRSLGFDTRNQLRGIVVMQSPAAQLLSFEPSNPD